MKTIKRYMALALVFAMIGAGFTLLAMDYETLTTSWVALAAAFVFFAAGIGLGYVFNRHNMLPE